MVTHRESMNHITKDRQRIIEATRNGHAGMWDVTFSHETKEGHFDGAVRMVEEMTAEFRSPPSASDANSGQVGGHRGLLVPPTTLLTPSSPSSSG